jgi:Na+/melibiose symporter-like transporter
VAAIPFLLNAGAFAAAAAALVLAMGGGVCAEEPSVAAGNADGSVLAEVREGLGWLARHRFLLTLAAITALLGLVDEAVFAVFVLYAQEILGLRDFGYGLLLAVGAAGGIFGGFAADALVRRVGSARAISFSLLLGVLSYFGIALTGSVALVAIMLVVNGAHLVLWNVTTLSLCGRRRSLTNCWDGSTVPTASSPWSASLPAHSSGASSPAPSGS